MRRLIRMAICHPDRPYHAKGLCQKCYLAKYQQENIDRHRATNRIWLRNWKQENPEASMLKGSRKRAKRKGLEFNLVLGDIVIPDKCPILGIPLTAGLALDHERDNWPTLDRLDSTKGYIKGNIYVISNKANMIKSYGTAEEHEAIAKWMREQK